MRKIGQKIAFVFGIALAVYFIVAGSASAQISPSFLLHFDESFNDTSGGKTKHGTVTYIENGNGLSTTPGFPEFSTATSKFGTGSLRGWRSGEPYGVVQYRPGGNALGFGKEDFTIDFWVYPTSQNEQLFEFSNRWGAFLTFWVIDSKVQVRMLYKNPSHGLTFDLYSLYHNSESLRPNTWNHVALVRSGGNSANSGTFKIAVNGKFSPAFTHYDDLNYVKNNASLFYNDETQRSNFVNRVQGLIDSRIFDNYTFRDFYTLTFGQFWHQNGTLVYPLLGNLDEFRVTKSALWTQDFIPPSSPALGADDGNSSLDLETKAEVVLDLDFDDVSNPFKDGSSYSTSFDFADRTGVLTPGLGISRDEKYSGAGSLELPGLVGRSLRYLPNAGNLNLGEEEFTIDFRVKGKFEIGNSFFSANDNANEAWFDFTKLNWNDGFGSRGFPVFRMVDSDIPEGNPTGNPTQVWMKNAQKDLKDDNLWHHVVIQRRNWPSGGGSSYITIIDDQVTDDWVTTYYTVRFPNISSFIFGYGSTEFTPFKGYIDDFKVVRGKALWPTVKSGDKIGQSLIPSCVGVQPDFATICPNVGESAVSANTDVSLVSVCSVEKKCEYTCDQGFRKEEGSCVPIPVEKDVTGYETSVLLHFDEGLNRFRDSSGKGAVVREIQNADASAVNYILPTFTSDGKFDGAVSFNGQDAGTVQAMAIQPSEGESNLTIGDEDFTVDFWLLPRSLRNGTVLFEAHTVEGGRLTVINGIGNKPYSYYPSGEAPAFNVQSASSNSGPSLVDNQWNHIAIQRKRVDTRSDEIAVAVNGRMGVWNRVPHLNFPKFESLFFGWPYANTSEQVNAYSGLIDEVRVVKGAAIFKDVVSYGAFSLPSGPARSVSTVTESPEGQERVPFGILTLGTEDRVTPAVSLPSFPGRRVISAPVAERTPSFTKTVKKANGERDFDMELDSEAVLLRKIYYANPTGEDKLRVENFDATGSLESVSYFGPSKTETDFVSYYSPALGGAIKSDRRLRSGRETYTEFDQSGRTVYSHEFENGRYLWSKHVTWEAERPIRELTYKDENNFESREYIYELAEIDGKIIESIKEQRLTKVFEDSGKPLVEYSVVSYESGKKTRIRTIKSPFIDSASGRIPGPASLIEELTFDAEGFSKTRAVYDFIGQKKTSTKYIIAGQGSVPEYDYTVQMVEDSPDGIAHSFTEYKYDGSSLNERVVTVFRNGNQKTPTSVTIYAGNGKIVKENTYAYNANGGWDTAVVAKYDKKGELITKESFDYTSAGRYPGSMKAYDKYGEITAEAKMDANSNRWLKYSYYFGGNTADEEKWFEYIYTYSADGNSYSVSGYYFGDGSPVLWRTYKYKKIGGKYVLDELIEPDYLVKKKAGEKILQGLAISSGEYYARIAETVKKVLEKYKYEMNLAGSQGRREALYFKHSFRLALALSAIEYEKWSGDASKGLKDDRSLQRVVFDWSGIDRNSGERFKGLYVIPGKNISEMVYIDFDNYEDTLTKASSFADLKNIPKKSEKWDAMPGTSPSNFIGSDGESSDRLMYYNESSTQLNKLKTRTYLSVPEITKADPSIMLLVDRMMLDLESEGIQLSRLDEKEIIKQVYEYFFDSLLFVYMNDFSDSVQTVGETFAKGGGDCEDFGIVLLSILRETFTRLGNSSIQSRLGLVLGRVSEASPVDSSNIGVGHGSVGYIAPEGMYYIEASYGFLGAGQARSLNREKILNPVSASRTTKTETVRESGWHVAIDGFQPINGAFQSFSEYAPQPGTATVGKNSAEKALSIPSHIDPYDGNVNKLANHFIKYIPEFETRSPEYIVDYVHSEFSRYTRYVSDTGEDNWKKVAETLAGNISDSGEILGTIDGDCEDLAFVEASVLQNILTKYFLARGIGPASPAPDQAEKYRQYVLKLGETYAVIGPRIAYGSDVEDVADASRKFQELAYLEQVFKTSISKEAAIMALNRIFVVAEKNYKGDENNPSHLYVGYVSPSNSPFQKMISLMDPQNGSKTPSVPFETILNDDYLFYANASSISAIGFYDWQTLNLSAVSAVQSFLQSIVNAVKFVLGIIPKTIQTITAPVTNLIGFNGEPTNPEQPKIVNDSNLDDVDISAVINQNQASNALIDPNEQAPGTIRIEIFGVKIIEYKVHTLQPGGDPAPNPLTTVASTWPFQETGTLTGSGSTMNYGISVAGFTSSSIPGVGNLPSTYFIDCTSSGYPVCGTKDDIARTPYLSGARPYGYFFRINDNPDNRFSLPEHARWDPAYRFACGQCSPVVYYTAWKCDSAYEKKLIDGKYECVRNDPPPNTPTICAPEKAIKNQTLVYSFVTKDQKLDDIWVNPDTGEETSGANVDGRVYFNVSFARESATVPSNTDIRYYRAYPTIEDAEKSENKNEIVESTVNSETTIFVPKNWSETGTKEISAVAVDDSKNASSIVKAYTVVGESTITMNAPTIERCESGEISLKWSTLATPASLSPTGYKLRVFKKGTREEIISPKVKYCDYGPAEPGNILPGTTCLKIQDLAMGGSYEAELSGLVSVATCGYKPYEIYTDPAKVEFSAPGACPKPDLDIDSEKSVTRPSVDYAVSTPTEIYVYQYSTVSSEIKANIKNISNDASATAFVAQTRGRKISNEADSSWDETQVGSSRVSFGSMAAGGKVEYSFNVPTADVGTYKYKICADDVDNQSRVSETNEQNNCSENFTVHVEPRRRPKVDFRIDFDGQERCGNNKLISINLGKRVTLCWEAKEDTTQ